MTMMIYVYIHVSCDHVKLVEIVRVGVCVFSVLYNLFIYF